MAAETATAYGVAPNLLDTAQIRLGRRAWWVAALAVIVLLGFGLRATQLGAEGLSEDELNKLQATQTYRTHGLTSNNGEHPFLMKALMTVSTIAAERWNGVAPDTAQISVEAALRLPVTIFGALTALVLFAVATQLFGPRIGLLAAALWAFDASAISFNRIAKEDSFLLFFFLLANAFWLRGQRVAESGQESATKYYWATAAAFGAMMASKYLPHLMAVSVSYYYVFQAHPRTQWRLGKAKWLLFFAVMGAAFVLCNPTILLPDTWHEMRVFAGEKRIGHDAYEFMGTLYRNQVSLWLKGSPWYFYYVFIGAKIPCLTVLGALVGLPLLFRRKLLGVGRFFVLFWILFWFFPFTFMGGKFTRYLATGLPVVFLLAAIGWDYVAQTIGRKWSAVAHLRNYAYVVLFVLVTGSEIYAAASVAPHYRLYINSLAGGWTRAGHYFPHDEFYDASVPATAAAIVRQARPEALVASETPALFSYYAARAGRTDLRSISLSDQTARAQLNTGDYVIIARGRRYFSNDALIKQLESSATPFTELALGPVPAVKIYRLDGPLP